MPRHKASLTKASFSCCFALHRADCKFQIQKVLTSFSPRSQIVADPVQIVARALLCKHELQLMFACSTSDVYSLRAQYST